MIKIKVGIRNNSKKKEKIVNELFDELRKYNDISKRFSSLDLSIPFKNLFDKLDRSDQTRFTENGDPALANYDNQFILLNDAFFTKTAEDQNFIFIHEFGHILDHQSVLLGTTFYKEYNEYLADKFLLKIDKKLLSKKINIFCKGCNLNDIENNIKIYKNYPHSDNNKNPEQWNQINNNFDRIFEIVFKLYYFLYLIDKDSYEIEKINKLIDMIRNKLEHNFDKVKIGRIFDNIKNISLNPDNILNTYEEIEKEIDLLNQGTK
ncbi:MAG: hypothetical protein KAT43_01320 [Nanoarchaeota archaeon]|nr:hypothetical protein [Nanoarchaeota archaeon]